MKDNIEIKLIQKINEKDNNKDDNLVFSPIGLEIILSLCANGAEGETQKEILKVLTYKNIKEANDMSKKIIEEFEKSDEVLKIANSVLTKVRAKEAFIKKGTNDYDAKIEELKHYRQVNEWAKKKTKNNIVRIIDKVPPNVIMILLNAIYFEALWKNKFDPNLTNEKEFFNYNEPNSIRTMMMFSKGELLNYYENNNLQAVKLNYEPKAKSMSAIIILPHQDIDINSFIKNFDNQIYEEIINGLNKEEKTKVNLYLPKFDIEFKAEISDILNDLGIKKAFTNNAEFKGICDKKPIHIGQVIQKNYINVNEEGTQASSITELEIMLECYVEKDQNSKDFNANRPFLFILRNENFPKGHDILFFSKVCRIGPDDDYY